MPRRPRCRQQAVCYHVYNRGWDRGALFHDDADFDRFVETAARYKVAQLVEVFHWAVLGNHYHLLIRTAFARLRPFVSGFQQSYAQYHHRRHGSCGVIWQRRYHSKPVQADECLTRCGRYIERNPVRAGLVPQASQWRWSSARFYVSGTPDGLTDADPQFGPGGGLKDAERSAYARMLEDDADDRWLAEHVGLAIGSRHARRLIRRQARPVVTLDGHGGHVAKRVLLVAGLEPPGLVEQGVSAGLCVVDVLELAGLADHVAELVGRAAGVGAA